MPRSNPIAKIFLTRVSRSFGGGYYYYKEKVISPRVAPSRAAKAYSPDRRIGTSNIESKLGRGGEGIMVKLAVSTNSNFKGSDPHHQTFRPHSRASCDSS